MFDFALCQCEREQATHDNDIIKQDIYSRRWNIIFYKIPEQREENCTALVKQVIVNELKMAPSEVPSFVFCGVHRLGKRSRGRPRPIIARFTCRSDRDKVWKLRRNLKGSQVNMGEDLPKRVQDLRENVLVPAELPYISVYIAVKMTYTHTDVRLWGLPRCKNL